MFVDKELAYASSKDFPLRGFVCREPEVEVPIAVGPGSTVLLTAERLHKLTFRVTENLLCCLVDDRLPRLGVEGSYTNRNQFRRKI